MLPRKPAGFTLIELLVVIAIIAILSVVVILTLNPGELLKQSRDSTRFSDLETLRKGISLLKTDLSTLSAGAAQTVYVSVPDSSATCANLGLPDLPAGWSYACASSSTLQKVDGSGWLPINFNAASFQAPFAVLPIDPVNSTSSGLYYTYAASSTLTQLTVRLESSKNQSLSWKDGGNDLLRYETGDALNIVPAADLSFWVKADSIRDLSDGAGVSTWPDSSLNGNTLSQASGSRQPVFKTGIANGRPVVRFDGVDDFLEAINNVKIGTAAIVLAYTGGSTFQTYAGVLSQRTTAGTIFRGDSGTTLWRSAGIGNPTDGYFGDNLFVNGRQTKEMSPLSTFKVASGFAYNSTPTTYTGLEVGRYTSNDSFNWKGDVAEIIIYGRILSTKDRQQIESYLNDKYNLF